MLELYIPKVEDMWFVQEMQADPDTMAYNAGWDVSYDGYHPDTGCIDLPESEWKETHARLVGHEPECFYALVREQETGTLVGEVNFHYTPDENWWDMGVLIHAPHRGKGYGHMALELLLHHAFLECGVSCLHNDFELDRDAGMTIHLRVGFRKCGEGRLIRFGAPVALQELMLTREQYAADRSKLRQVVDPEEKANITASVLADLPQWFGIPESTAEYVKNSRELPFWAAEFGDEILGFVALNETGPKTAEIHVMGLRPQYHRCGVGERLFRALHREAKERGYRFLQVKTVQEGCDPGYDKTNAFYRAMGFTEFECFPTLWDERNPCQVYVMSIQ